ncbi:hypothetical protein [Streptomyces sp. NPDC093514]|uniref:hypothetical protein n=1 Tax=Streptomyces sp. NPDC093514 TaxID=3366039 RepID=UPI0038106A09
MEYTIIRVYKVPASSQVEATDRFMKARELGVTRDYLVRDYVRGPTESGIRTTGRVRLASWWTLVRQQLLGR